MSPLRATASESYRRHYRSAFGPYAEGHGASRQPSTQPLGANRPPRVWQKRNLQKRQTMPKLQIICYGALGGCCPTIAKLGSHYSAQWDASPPGMGVFLALLSFAILGSIIAIAADPRTLKAAIFAGIAAPGIVTSIMSEQNFGSKGTSQQQETQEQNGYLFLFGIRTAVADSHRTPSTTASDNAAKVAQRIWVETATDPHPGPWYDANMQVPEIPIVAHIKKDGVFSEIVIGKIPQLNAKAEFTIPLGSTKISVADRVFDLSNLESITVNSTAKPRGGLLDEFLWAIGQKRKYSFDVNDVVPSYK